LYREGELLVGVVVVRPEAQGCVGAEVAEDAALTELLVHRLELRHAHRHRAAAARGVAWRGNLEARLVGQADQELRLTQRVLADPLHADLPDQDAARRR